MSAALGPAFGYIGGAAQLTRWVDFDKGEVILNKQIFIDNIRKSQKSLELWKKYFANFKQYLLRNIATQIFSFY